MKPYYEQDGITIYHGDCRETAWTDVTAVTDPPYGIGYESNYGETIAPRRSIENDHSTECLEWCFTFKKSAVFVPWRHRALVPTEHIIVWDKGPAFGMGDLSFPWKRSFEIIALTGQWRTDYRDEGVRRGKTVQSKYSWGRLHPHQKPEWLMAELIRACPDEDIIDPFMGSGSTLVAAKRIGRRAIGVELEERYCEIAAKRLSQQVLFGVEETG